MVLLLIYKLLQFYLVNVILSGVNILGEGTNVFVYVGMVLNVDVNFIFWC